MEGGRGVGAPPQCSLGAARYFKPFYLADARYVDADIVVSQATQCDLNCDAEHGIGAASGYTVLLGFSGSAPQGRYA